MDILSTKIISKNIKKYREKAGITQDNLARKADIPFSTYQKIEGGFTPNPSIQTLLNIANALGVKVDDLIRK